MSILLKDLRCFAHDINVGSKLHFQLTTICSQLTSFFSRVLSTLQIFTGVIIYSTRKMEYIIW